MKNIHLFLFCLIISLAACTKKDGKLEEPKKEETPKEAKEDIVQISTTYGDMYIWLYKATPLHRENFLKLAKEGYYNNTTFHRIITDFMIQGGDPNSKDSDPNNDGQGGPAYTIPAEIRDSIKHERGALGAARNNNPTKSSSGSQFYICHSTSGTTPLNNDYTVFGMVMKGQNVIDSVVKQPKDANDRPNTDIKMQVKVLQKSKTEIKAEYGYDAKL